MTRRAAHSVELCAGAGGLALATSQAGFTPLAFVESDSVACDTLNENRLESTSWAKDWPIVVPADIREFDYSTISTPVDLLSGGPPCQPFSIAGKHLGIDDDRDLFPEVARAMAALKPRAVLLENTNGIARSSFARQLRYICMQLAYPEHRRRPREHWETTLTRLERMHKTKTCGLRYRIYHTVLNAADFGVPQRRARLIIVGFRESETPFAFPKATHSLEALLYQQWVTAEYWDRHKIALRDRPLPPELFKAQIARLKEKGEAIDSLPWVTVRDVIASLPKPTKTDSGDISNHVFQRGARAYPGHSGSALDFPAKVLKAGRHGVPGGENMLAHRNGKVRYFTIRECARLQTFPDDYRFSGPWTRSTRQLGNAVPVLMCRRIAEAIASHLTADKQSLPMTAAHEHHGPRHGRTSLLT